MRGWNRAYANYDNWLNRGNPHERDEPETDCDGCQDTFTFDPECLRDGGGPPELCAPCEEREAYKREGPSDEDPPSRPTGYDDVGYYVNDQEADAARYDQED